MLIARVILGIAEGPLFSLKTRFISDNFSAQEIGKPNAVTALGVSLGLAVGFPLVTWLMSHLGWAGSFYALAAINLLLGGGLIWRFLPAPRKLPTAKKPGFVHTFTLAWQTPLLGWIMVVEIATLSYLWGAAPGYPRGCVTSITFRCMPRAGLRRSPSCSAWGQSFWAACCSTKCVRNRHRCCLWWAGR